MTIETLEKANSIYEDMRSITIQLQWMEEWKKNLDFNGLDDFCQKITTRDGMVVLDRIISRAAVEVEYDHHLNYLEDKMQHLQQQLEKL